MSIPVSASSLSGSAIDSSIVDSSVSRQFSRLQAAQLAATLAGRIQKEYYRSGFEVETKSSAIDLVTSADKACDEAIRHLLKTFFPTDPILTEETYEEGTPIHLETGTWVIDPIDGTTNYAHGFPMFSVSIAYVEQGKPQVGVIYNPMTDEQFWAVRGEGAYLNETPIHVSGVEQLGASLLATGFPYDSTLHPKDNLGYFEHFLTHSHGVRRLGSAALDLAYVAAGRLDGFWELRLSPWDVAAGVLLVEEAGGRVTNFADAPLDISQRRIHILASNGQDTLHNAMVQVLSQ